MRLLLDTHAVIWFFNGDEQLSVTAKSAILSPANQTFVSIASAWEIAIKLSLKKLAFHGGVTGFLRLLDDNGIALLPVERRHLAGLGQLPWYHRDPFDRLLISTALADNLSLVSHDQNMRRYSVRCLW